MFALFPLTTVNRKLYEENCTSDHVFVRVSDRLEKGKFGILSEKDAIYLPPGYLHATLTLKGGLTPGIDYITTTCLEASAVVWDIHMKVFEMSESDSTPLLEAVMMGLRSDERETNILAAQLFCDRWKPLRKAGRAAEAQKLQGKACLHCHQPWNRH